jgi:hypothetical protein
LHKPFQEVTPRIKDISQGVHKVSYNMKLERYMSLSWQVLALISQYFQ